MNRASKRKRDQDGCLAIQAYISADDALQRASAIELIGYLFAYAEQTGTNMRAIPNHAERGVYKLIFCFQQPDNRIDFLHLVQLNDAIACAEEDLLSPNPDELFSARPISHILPMDLVPQILSFADALLGHYNRTSGI